MRGNKYHARRTPCRRGETHASAGEARRCDELTLMQHGGLVSELEAHPQPEWLLVVNGYKIGDTIFYVCEVIVKPTHVKRGNRMVHVRYEAEKKFSYGETTINRIDFDGRVFFNSGIRIENLCESLEEAKIKAEQKQKSYDEHVAFSSLCR